MMSQSRSISDALGVYVGTVNPWICWS